MRNSIAKGLYTNNSGRQTVYLFDSWQDNWLNPPKFTVDYEDVKTGDQEEIPLDLFKIRFPHKIDKIEVQFKDVNKKFDCEAKPSFGLYTDHRGRSVVYVYDVWGTKYRNGVEYANVKNNERIDLSWEEFNKKYPHKVEKVLIEFK